MDGQGYTTFGYLKMQMVVAHGGRCAERLIFGNDITDGGKDDLEKITKVDTSSLICGKIWKIITILDNLKQNLLPWVLILNKILQLFPYTQDAVNCLAY